MKKFLFLICAGVLMSSCSLHKMDWPTADVQDKWQKPGYTKNDVARFLWKDCGYKNDRELAKEKPGLDPKAFQREWDTMMVRAEECMLANGFVYVDEPDGFVGGICKYPDYQHRPSCQSLKKTREQTQ